MKNQNSRLSSVWKNRKQIVEGILNNVFTKETVDAISEERLDECLKCSNYDLTGESCVMPGTGPCCKSCGCSLKLATKSLSYKCPESKWPVYISNDENTDLSILIKYKSDLDTLKQEGKVTEEEFKALLIQIASSNQNEAGYGRMQIRNLMNS